jgi:hypothetical protein
MPKFAPERWKPADDSSEGYRTLDPDSVVLHVALRMDGPGQAMGCPCGCGDFPMGDKATFCMGHDARLRGVLIRAHLMGVSIRYCLGNADLGEPTPAMMVAEQYLWASYLESAVLRRDGKNREVLRRALGAENLVKVGKLPETGQVAAVYTAPNDRHIVEFVNQAGEIRKIRVAAGAVPDPA